VDASGRLVRHKFSGYPFLVVQRQNSLLFASRLLFGRCDSRLRSTVMEPCLLAISNARTGYGEDGLLKIRAAGHYFQSVHNLSNVVVQGAPIPG